MRAPLNENGPASAATDPDRGSATLTKGQAMDALENTTPPATPATGRWSDEILALLANQPLNVAPTEAELPSDHPRFEVVQNAEFRRGPSGRYDQLVSEYFTIERRKVAA